MARILDDWLRRYVEYASVTEAPKRMHFWAGVGAIAGALRRKVWIDMKRFTWFPSFYIIYVAPPGIVAKSTTADISMNLLRAIPGIKFGPNSITWQALVTAFAGASESFEYPVGSGDWNPMSPLNFVASELGSLVNLQDRDMVNLLIELWDGKKSYDKITKMSGNDVIEAPWINIQGCTTPHWIADNMPSVTIGGGLSSRCVFLYADEKDKYVPYVDEVIAEDDSELQQALIHDLEHISMSLCGPFTIDPAARAWGREWYINFWKQAKSRDDNMLESYAVRKQTHMHKLAMVISASHRDDLVIGLDELQLANAMLEDLEVDMPKVFSRVGRSEQSLQAEKLLQIVQRRGAMPYEDILKVVQVAFPDVRDMEGILTGLMRAGYIDLINNGAGMIVKARASSMPQMPISSSPPVKPPYDPLSEETSTPNL